MRTRVVQEYYVTTATWAYGVQQWLDKCDGVTGWHSWPYPYCAGWRTPDREKAMRVAKEVSEGKKVDPQAIAEFVDGVQTMEIAL